MLGTVLSFAFDDEPDVPPPLELQDARPIGAPGTQSTIARDVLAHADTSLFNNPDVANTIFVVGSTDDPSLMTNSGVGIPPATGFAGVTDGFVLGIVDNHSFTPPQLSVWGANGLGVADPPPGPNTGYVRVGAGGLHSVALRTDGTLVAWGSNYFGQTNVPPLPPGVTYVDFAVGFVHTVALRSDGQAVSFGFNGFGEGTIPALPAGVRYVEVAACEAQTMLRRSDGVVVCLGENGNHQQTVPPPPPGLRYVEIAPSRWFNSALLSDGTAVHWGGTSSPRWHPLPPLPPGVSYVEIEGGYHQVVARRSDGQVVQRGHGPPVPFIPQLDPGTSYVEVSAGVYMSAARVGPPSTYVTFANGCAGSRPTARLVPQDTPRIGSALEILVLDLPLDVAFLAFGWSRTPPVSLAPVGMPGCAAHVTVDAVALLAGQGGTASFALPIPDVPAMVGLRFFHQAFVPDPAAGNAAGAVVSDAAEGAVGDW